MTERDLIVIAERLAAAVPEGTVVVFLPPGELIYYGPDGLEAWTDVEPYMTRGDLAHAAYSMLNFVQDNVIRDIRDQWPSWGGVYAMPQVAEVGEHVHVWYGNETTVAFEIGMF